MATMVPPQKNVEYIFYVGLVSQADTKLLQNNPTLAAGDVLVSTDGGSTSNLDTLPAVTPASSDMVKVTVSATEMNGDNIIIVFSDAAGSEWCDLLINIQTSGQSLDTTDAAVDAIPTTAMRGTDSAALASAWTAALATVLANYTAARAGYLDELAAANLPTDIAAIPTASEIQTEMEADGASLLDTIRDELANATDGLSALKDLIDEVQANVESIEITGSSLNQIAGSDTLTTGTESSGTYANTATEDGVYHIITAASNEIDIYYEFDIGEFGIPVAVHIWGYLKEGAPKGGDTIDLYAYNWGGTAFEVVHFDIFTGIITDDPHEVSATLLNRHVGTGANEGKVRIRFQATSLEAGTTLNIDEIIISYAEALGSNIDAILADVTGINGAAMVGTNGAALASSWTSALATILANFSAARIGYLDNINNANLATIADISSLTATEIAYLDQLDFNLQEALNTIVGYIDTEVTAIVDALGNGTYGLSALQTLLAAAALESTLITMKQKVAGTFNRETDSLEALRDRGDAAWITGAGGSAPTVAQIVAGVYGEALPGSFAEGTAGERIAKTHKFLKNKKAIVYNNPYWQWIIYDDDGTTAIYTLNLTRGGDPTSFSPDMVVPA